MRIDSHPPPPLRSWSLPRARRSQPRMRNDAVPAAVTTALPQRPFRDRPNRAMTDENPYQSPSPASRGSSSFLLRSCLSGVCAFSVLCIVGCTGVVNVLYIGPEVKSWSPDELTFVGRVISGIVKFYLSFWHLVAIGAFIVALPLFFRLFRRRSPAPTS